MIASGFLLTGAISGGVCLNNAFQEKLFSKCLEFVDSEVIFSIVEGVNKGIDLKPDEQALILGVVGGLYVLNRVANNLYDFLESKNVCPKYI